MLRSESGKSVSQTMLRLGIGEAYRIRANVKRSLGRCGFTSQLGMLPRSKAPPLRRPRDWAEARYVSAISKSKVTATPRATRCGGAATLSSVSRLKSDDGSPPVGDSELLNRLTIFRTSHETARLIQSLSASDRCHPFANQLPIARMGIIATWSSPPW